MIRDVIARSQGRLEDQGRLLMQGAFNVWASNKKESLRALRFKPMQRHVFLYEARVVLCKKKDDSGHVERASYIYKNSLEVRAAYSHRNEQRCAFAGLCTHLCLYRSGRVRRCTTEHAGCVVTGV